MFGFKGFVDLNRYVCITISIHYMFGFKELTSNPVSTARSFQYIICLGSSLFFCVVLQTLFISIHYMFGFKLLLPRPLISNKTISIHYMFGFKLMLLYSLISQAAFQYIICLGSRKYSIALSNISFDFNTLYVWVQEMKKKEKELLKVYFNTLYVWVQVILII